MQAFETDADQGTDGARELESLRRELDEQKQRNLRLLADFNNLRRRRQRDQAVASEEGRRAALVPLLSVLDSLERALAAGSIDPEFYEGVAATQRQFLAALREAGAEPIETVGFPFDPKVHEAVATVPAEDAEPGTVVNEVRRGWRVGADLLRPAQVEIAASRETAGPWR